VNTPLKDQQAPTQQSTQPPARLTITQRVRRLWQSLEQRSSRPAPDVDWQRRLERLEASTEHFELVLEGLQDAVHRRAVREDESIGELRRRTEPDQIARDLSRNARTRGL
jgi:hypothetical protein